MPNKICLINPREGELLTAGVELSCRDHRHVDEETARLAANGSEVYPWMERGYRGFSSEPFKPIAVWAVLANGKTSGRYLIVLAAWEWRGRRGTLQYVALGLMPPARRHTKTRCARRVLYSATQCADTNADPKRHR